MLIGFRQCRAWDHSTFSALIDTENHRIIVRRTHAGLEPNLVDGHKLQQNNNTICEAELRSTNTSISSHHAAYASVTQIGETPPESPGISLEFEGSKGGLNMMWQVITPARTIDLLGQGDLACRACLAASSLDCGWPDRKSKIYQLHRTRLVTYCT